MLDSGSQKVHHCLEAISHGYVFVYSTIGFQTKSATDLGWGQGPQSIAAAFFVWNANCYRGYVGVKIRDFTFTFTLHLLGSGVFHIQEMAGPCLVTFGGHTHTSTTTFSVADTVFDRLVRVAQRRSGVVRWCARHPHASSSAARAAMGHWGQCLHTP